MHFSRPSGQRLSWCRPWNRGAVGFFSKGYSSVTTFLNIVRKVTPKPAIGSQNCSLRVGIYSRFPSAVAGDETVGVPLLLLVNWSATWWGIGGTG